MDNEQLLVLNAFRHHGIGHYLDTPRHTAQTVCSTPSGIMESVTLACSKPSSSPRSAQRLPASWNRSPLSCPHADDLAQVLNAFRHHGIGHPALDRFHRPPTSAQRLPASWNRSQIYAKFFGFCYVVLNAFRHHGIGHPARRAGVLPGRRVLNAFRHHGIGHKALTNADALMLPCSTPSGIMESVTHRRRISLLFRPVLNAFRHHGIGHLPSSKSDALISVCSTPSGIMESVTLSVWQLTIADRGAQRLPASWNRSRQDSLI